jgi:hypothetical protein
MATTDVKALPDSVLISPGMVMSPNEMRMLKEKTGRPLGELLGGDPEDLDQAPDRLQSLVWIELRRRGYDVDWEEVGDVRPELEARPVEDPTNGAGSMSSPPSVIGGE